MPRVPHLVARLTLFTVALFAVALCMPPADADVVKGGGQHQDTRYGFTIAPPVFPVVQQGKMVQAVTFVAPADGTFAANLNVMVQAMKVSPAQYLADTEGFAKKAWWKVNAVRKTKVSGQPALYFDYEGKMGGMELHWFALAVVRSKDVVLATCTTLREKARQYKAACEKSLQSLQVAPR